MAFEISPNSQDPNYAAALTGNHTRPNDVSVEIEKKDYTLNDLNALLKMRKYLIYKKPLHQHQLLHTNSIVKKMKKYLKNKLIF